MTAELVRWPRGAAVPERRYRTTCPPLPHLPLHLDWLRMRNLSPRYVDMRSFTIRRVARHLGADPVDVTAAELLEWERTRQVSAGTLAGEVTQVVEYCGWAVREGIIAVDPSTRLVMPKLPRRLPRPAVEADLLRAIGDAPRVVRLCLVLAGFEGLRACELANLDRVDVFDRDDPPSVRLRGKGDKERIIPLGRMVLDELRRYGLPVYGPVFERGDGQHGHNTGSRISQIVSEYLRDNRFTFTLHQARHRFATQLYRQTLDIRMLQELMGHTNPGTTALYAAVNVARSASAVDTLSRGLSGTLL
jgi:integrase/recombinase XerC